MLSVFSFLCCIFDADILLFYTVRLHRAVKFYAHNHLHQHHHWQHYQATTTKRSNALKMLFLLMASTKKQRIQQELKKKIGSNSLIKKSSRVGCLVFFNKIRTLQKKTTNKVNTKMKNEKNWQLHCLVDTSRYRYSTPHIRIKHTSLQTY